MESFLRFFMESNLWVNLMSIDDLQVTIIDLLIHFFKRPFMWVNWKGSVLKNVSELIIQSLSRDVSPWNCRSHHPLYPKPSCTPTLYPDTLITNTIPIPTPWKLSYTCAFLPIPNPSCPYQPN